MPERFTLTDIDTNLVTDEIRCFTVALGLDEKQGDANTTEMIGSGTLVSWGDKVGIVTASHVIEETSLMSRKTLRLAGRPGEAWEFPTDLLNIRTIGHYNPSTEEEGPDLAVIELPSASYSQVGLLKATRSFYNLEKDKDSRVEEVINGDGVMAVAGTLGKTREHQGVANGVDEVKYDGFVGYSTHDEYFERNEFDYFDVKISYADPSYPTKYGGMSGGGLWMVPVRRGADGTFTRGNALLAGVNFYQSDLSPQEGAIRCHGVKSLYKVVRA